MSPDVPLALSGAAFWLPVLAAAVMASAMMRPANSYSRAGRATANSVSPRR